MHRHTLQGALSVIAGCSLALAAGKAGAFSELVVFGDSLSDNGNVYRLTQGYSNNPLLPFPPDRLYADGRQSNGPVAVEYLSQRLRAPLRNFAQAGATTGTANIWDDGALGEPPGALGLSGMRSQVQSYVAQAGAADSNALYVLWGGPNDFVAGLANPGTFDPVAAIANAVTNLSNEAGQLYSNGARHFLIPNMADLGLAPRARSAGLSAPATGLTTSFNSTLDAALSGLRASLAGATIHGLDTFGLSQETFAEFSGGDPGAAEVTLACLSVPACAGDPQTQATFLFWDDLHPTTQIHSILGGEMAAAVPEPETWALFLAGLALAAWQRRRSLGELHARMQPCDEPDRRPLPSFRHALGMQRRGE
ncbi:MAG: SGNH/GDSL hydrolase family protein [Burkholderiales bacterium]